MARRYYDISTRLTRLMERRNIGLARLSELLSPTPRTKVRQWLNGKPALDETVFRIASKLRVRPEDLTGCIVPVSNRRPCGMRRVLAMLNQDGGDYLGEDGPLAVTIYRGAFGEEMPIFRRGLSDHADKCAGGY